MENFNQKINEINKLKKETLRSKEKEIVSSLKNLCKKIGNGVYLLEDSIDDIEMMFEHGHEDPHVDQSSLEILNEKFRIILDLNYEDIFKNDFLNIKHNCRVETQEDDEVMGRFRLSFADFSDPKKIDALKDLFNDGKVSDLIIE